MAGVLDHKAHRDATESAAEVAAIQERIRAGDRYAGWQSSKNIDDRRFDTYKDELFREYPALIAFVPNHNAAPTRLAKDAGIEDIGSKPPAETLREYHYSIGKEMLKDAITDALSAPLKKGDKLKRPTS